MRYPLVIFDVDGTLVDTREATIHAAQMAYRKLTGKSVPEDAWPDVFALSAHESAAHMGVDPDAYEREELESYKQIAESETRLFPGVMEVLEELCARGCQFGVCTARVHEEMAFDFTRLGLDRFEWVTACADETEKAKPDPEAVNRILKEAGVSDPCQAVYLGDLPVDQECAKAGGVAFAQAAWLGEEPLSGSEYVLREPSELIGIVLGLDQG